MQKKLPFKLSLLTLGLALLTFSGWAEKPHLEAPMADSIYHFTLRTIDGQDQNLGAYQGKVLLLVNVASRCGFTKQYAGLQALYEKYKDRGLVVLGIPANNFMGQEPGTDEEIKKFCSLKYNVTFPMFSKISVKGKDIHPLYHYLTEQSPFPGDIGWNFNKFLINAQGTVAARYGSKTAPEDAELIAQIESLLPKA
jgi:glutathione peroxidase-family protein